MGKKLFNTGKEEYRAQIGGTAEEYPAYIIIM